MFFFCRCDAGFEVKDVVAAGITNQRESTVVWDKNTGKPLHNVIGELFIFRAL